MEMFEIKFPLLQQLQFICHRIFDNIYVPENGKVVGGNEALSWIIIYQCMKRDIQF